MSTEPDGTLVKWQSYRAKRVRLIPRKDTAGRYLEVRGRPDWILEVVSLSSIHKDTVVLREIYHRVGIPEYWLIDALPDTIDFQILVHRRKDYKVVQPQDGWYFSPVFGRSFRLERSRDPMGEWWYDLRVK